MTVENIATRTALAALASPISKVAYLMEAGREGIFTFQQGDFTNNVTKDPLQGLYVQSDTIALTAGCWVRDFENGPLKPEWFGAKTNNAAFNCAPALNAALSFAPLTRPNASPAIQGVGRVQLAAAIYYCSNGIVIPDFGVLEGAGPLNSGIVVNHPTDHLINCSGTATTYLDSPRCSNFSVSRSVAPTTPANAANDNAQGHGIHCSMVTNPIFENVYTYDNLVELYIANVLTGRFEHIRGLRTKGGQADRWYGVWVDGVTQRGPFGGPSNNPSLTVAYPNMVCGFEPSTGYGIYGNGSITDFWLVQPETARGTKGIFFNLGGQSVVDVNITHPICDAYRTNGIHISGANFASAINIDSPYVAGAAQATGAAVRIESSHGVAISNMQAIGTLATGVFGVEFSDGSECSVSGRFVDYATAGYAISAAACAFDIKAVKNFGAASSAQVFTLIGGQRNQVSIAAIGSNNAWTNGIALDASAINCVLDVSRVANGIATNRINRAGAAISLQGNINTHLIINPGVKFQA